MNISSLKLKSTLQNLIRKSITTTHFTNIPQESNLPYGIYSPTASHPPLYGHLFIMCSRV